MFPEGKAAALWDVLLKSLGEKLLQRNLHGCNVTVSHFSLLSGGTGVQRYLNLPSDYVGGWLTWKPAELMLWELTGCSSALSGVYSCAFEHRVLSQHSVPEQPVVH